MYGESTLTEAKLGGELDYRVFAEESPFPVWLSDVQMNRVYFNSAWLSYTGRSLEQEVGQGWRANVHSQDLKKIDDAGERAMESRSNYQTRFRLQSSYGDYRPFLEHAYPRFSTDGNFLGYIGSVSDKRVFDKTLREFMQLRREHDEMAHVISHDLKAPLRAIEGFSEALLEDCAGEISLDAREFLREITDGVGRMGGLIDDLISYARLGKDQLTLNPVNTRETVLEAMESLQEEIDRSQAEVFLIGPFPIVEGYRRALFVLFQSLIDNSIKFKSEGIPPEIKIEAITRETQHLFIYSDNGIGIEPNHWEEVFGVFRRLHVTSQYPGTGIGLALARKAVELHEGRIQIVPGVGSGLTLEIRFPRPHIESGSS